jgi:hypothetical protein
MEDAFAILHGELATWPSREQMAGILRDAGLSVYIGQYSIRVENCEHFSFEHYGSDLGDPVIDADAETADAMKRDAILVSNALKRAGIRHRFEIYDSADRLIEYLHFEWPPPNNV